MHQIPNSYGDSLHQRETRDCTRVWFQGVKKCSPTNLWLIQLWWWKLWEKILKNETTHNLHRPKCISKSEAIEELKSSLLSKFQKLAKIVNWLRQNLKMQKLTCVEVSFPIMEILVFVKFLPPILEIPMFAKFLPPVCLFQFSYGRVASCLIGSPMFHLSWEICWITRLFGTRFLLPDNIVFC